MRTIWEANFSLTTRSPKSIFGSLDFRLFPITQQANPSGVSYEKHNWKDLKPPGDFFFMPEASFFVVARFYTDYINSIQCHAGNGYASELKGVILKIQMTIQIFQSFVKSHDSGRHIEGGSNSPGLHL